MQYRLGNSKKIKDNGEIKDITCPKCNEISNFEIFSNLDTRLKPAFPLINSNNVYFLVCPKCASVFTIDKESFKKYKNSGEFAITSAELKELIKFE